MSTTVSFGRSFPQSMLALAVMSVFCQQAYAAESDLLNQAQPEQSEATQTLPTIQVKAQTVKNKRVQSVPSDAAKQFPASKASVTAEQAATTINVVNTEDALKYLPDVLVRKRYIGDTQAPLATRTTGVNGSARSLIFADGVLLSTLINNNNGNGSPQWFMVAPEEISRIDVMYGPYSAAYAGNSYGAVTDITTKMPDHFQASATARGTTQDFGLYSSKDRNNAGQVNLFLGNKVGDFSWVLSAEHLDSTSQPITFGTIAQSTKVASANLPVVTGAIADQNRTGGAIQILGAGNIVHTIQDNVKWKMAYDFTPTLSASYMIGFWQNQVNAKVESYLTTSGASYYGASSGNVNIGGYSYSANSIAGQFSSNAVEQQHLLQSLTIGTHDQEGFNWSMIASNMRYLEDQTRTSTGLYPVAQDGGAGRITDASGTGWTTLDLKGNWSTAEGILAAHQLSFGAHEDWFKLDSPTYNTADWTSGDQGSLYSNSFGQTQTQALWLQDVWQLTPVLKATVGGRYEQWKATSGYNYSTASNGKSFAVNQPSVDKSGFSPKASLAWAMTDLWTVTGSVGKALRFPTVGELYQNVQTGTTYTQANPFLKPENVLSDELAFERKIEASNLRLSLFEEHVSDALISQTAMIAGYTTPVSFTQNVDKTRQRGIELAGQHDDVWVQGLSLAGNVTYVNAETLQNDSYVPTIAGATSVGKHTPYIPDWRATLVATYQPNPKWAFTIAGRYSGKQYATVDNTDINADAYQGFQSFFVMDARASYRFDRHWTAALGVDNLNNRQFFLYHPFQQRTVLGELKYRY